MAAKKPVKATQDNEKKPSAPTAATTAPASNEAVSGADGAATQAALQDPEGAGVPTGSENAATSDGGDKTGEETGAPAATEKDGDVNSDAEPVIKSLIVTSKKEGFRRAGRAWSTTPVTLRADELTPEQIEQLLFEPMLSVAFVADLVEVAVQ